MGLVVFVAAEAHIGMIIGCIRLIERTCAIADDLALHVADTLSLIRSN